MLFLPVSRSSEWEPEQRFIDWSAQLASNFQSNQTRQFDELIVGTPGNFQTTFEESMARISAEQDRMELVIQQVQHTSVTASAIDTQAMIQAVADNLIPQFQAKFQALDQAIFRQSVTISEVVNRAKRLPETTTSPRQNQAKSVSSHQARQTEQNVLRLIPANASRDEIIAEAIRLHEGEGLSSYKIAEKLGKSAKTVQSWLSKGKDQAESEVREVSEVTNEG